jgi:hypothetical protein
MKDTTTQTAQSITVELPPRSNSSVAAWLPMLARLANQSCPRESLLLHFSWPLKNRRSQSSMGIWLPMVPRMARTTHKQTPRRSQRQPKSKPNILKAAHNMAQKSWHSASEPNRSKTKGREARPHTTQTTHTPCSLSGPRRTQTRAVYTWAGRVVQICLVRNLGLVSPSACVW